MHVKQSVVRMPIKAPQTKVTIPQELDNVIPLAKAFIAHEKVNNPNWNNVWVHMTADTSYINYEEGENYHRYPGWHSDGILPLYLESGDPMEHSYIYVTHLGTQFAHQPFKLTEQHLTERTIFSHINQQTELESIKETKSQHMYLINAYQIHRTPKISYPLNRTFIRFTVHYNNWMLPDYTPNPYLKETYRRVEHMFSPEES